MGRTTKDKDDKDTRPRLATLAFARQEEARRAEEAERFEDAAPEDDAESKDKDGDSGEEGRQGGGDSGGGVYFEETEHDFDPTELQGLSLPIFRGALKKGLKLASRITKHWERHLHNFLPDIGLRSRVLEVALSENGHPTLLLDKGEIVQYQHSNGKLERVRVSPDLEAERAVKFAMAGFVAAGESIDPKHVKFGRSPEFESRMKPIWTREWNKIQQHENELRIGAPRKDVSFRHSIVSPIRKEPVLTRAWTGIQPLQAEKSHMGLPRMTMARARGPQF